MDRIAKIKANVDKNRDLILKTERYIWEHPETGRYSKAVRDAYAGQ